MIPGRIFLKAYLFLKRRLMNYDYDIISHGFVGTAAAFSLIAGSFELKYRDTNRSTIDRSGSAASSAARLIGAVLPSAIAAVSHSLLGSKSSFDTSLKYPLTSSIFRNLLLDL
jgi:hypothetical protein